MVHGAEKIDVIHYWDDFLIISPPEAIEKDDLGCALDVYRDLGVPITAHNIESPSTTIGY